MKFEQLLRIYWSRKFLYGGHSFDFNIFFEDFKHNLRGLGTTSHSQFLKRFELNHFEKPRFNSLTLFEFSQKSLKKTPPINKKLPIEDKFMGSFSNDFKKTINIFLAQLSSIRNDLFELIRINIIRLYLIKNFKGFCHALGKPLRGQRTRSNARTSKNNNLIIRKFLTYIKKTLNLSSQQRRKLLIKKIKIGIKKTKFNNIINNKRTRHVTKKIVQKKNNNQKTISNRNLKKKKS